MELWGLISEAYWFEVQSRNLVLLYDFLVS